MSEQEQPQSHEDKEIMEKMEQLLRDINEEDQSSQAIKTLANMISLLYKSLVESEISEEVACAFTQTYIEVVVSTMLSR